jgi:hypothetical protein
MGTLLAILGFITKFIDPLAAIGKEIAAYKLAQVNAVTEQAKIEAGEHVEALKAKRDVLVAESATSRINMFVRCFMALPIGCIIWKLCFWDIALGQWTHGTTEAIDGHVWNLIYVVTGFYFMFEITKVIKR